MSYAAYQSTAAAHAPADIRADFIRKTYAHLGGAILACTALCAALMKSSFGEKLAFSLMNNWLLTLGAFIVAGWVAERWASSGGSASKQYLGLGLYVVAQAIILLPILFIADRAFPGENVIGTAGILTGVVFSGLTATVFMTKKDFSFVGQALSIASFAALGFILVSMLFGFSLGSFFSSAMVVLAAGYILYYTSNILRHYPIGSHVAASLALFSAVALLFFYILQLVMSFAGDD